MKNPAEIRQEIRSIHLSDEKHLILELINNSGISEAQRKRITKRATALIEDIRADNDPGLMEVFLSEYGLSSDEGIALMCLAEALLRVPDSQTIDELIEDKIAPSSWGEHLGKSSSSLVNASTWALMLTGKVLDEERSDGVAGVLHGALKRLGEPIIRSAVKRAMKEMGNQFVLGETIDSAIERGNNMITKGFTYSYDMLGEAALTANDASTFYQAYADSIHVLAKRATSTEIRSNPGISVKLSALYPRYEVSQKEKAKKALTARTIELALLAKQANMGFNIDAEESERLDLSLDIIEAVLSDPRLKGWSGFGIVVQAYSKRASAVLDWLYTLTQTLDRKIMVRLVKGAYWDTEIKRSQVEGLKDYPVFCRKAFTDIAYICCAKKLLGMTDRIYPQFATHNAHSVAAILEFSESKSAFEFQKLHGMGEALHRLVMEKENTQCRIYAPVGTHRDLLAYLVRRLLENGANSSFVNQIVDEKVSPKEIAADPFLEVLGSPSARPNLIPLPAQLYAPERKNSRGWDLHDECDLAIIDEARGTFKAVQWKVEPLLADGFVGTKEKTVFSPANRQDKIGTLIQASQEDVEKAIEKANTWARDDETNHNETRKQVLNRAADLYEKNIGEIFAALCREAGKTPMDAIAEVREAVDFLRYYAAQIDGLQDRNPRGLIGCISPWNFPLAIFTGQIAAALAAGNGVLAKPADPTPIVSSIAVKLLHQAGVPRNVLQLLPGRGSVVGAALVSSPKVSGICFTGSTATAQTINKSMSKALPPEAPLIAETGGLNVMIVDSTALPQQAVNDIITSAFQSAGQRCSALRLLYLQEDIATSFMAMLFGAMDELTIGDPWEFSTDVGPVINEGAFADITNHIDEAKRKNAILKQTGAPQSDTFIPPTVIKVKGIEDLTKEIFGPVLHIATFESHQLDDIVEKVNASGYGLTFGLHTRIDDRVEQVVSQLNVGNIYINRNQIGAIVGSQPFGGEGLSGTGPKAGGPNYVHRFSSENTPTSPSFVVTTEQYELKTISFDEAQRTLNTIQKPSRQPLNAIDLPGPTGESNRLTLHPRGCILCLGPNPEDAQAQSEIAKSMGCSTLIICPNPPGDSPLDGQLPRKYLTQLNGFDAVALWNSKQDQKQTRIALAERDGPLIPLITEKDMASWCHIERHVCIDTTASGGNTTLLSQPNN